MELQSPILRFYDNLTNPTPINKSFTRKAHFISTLIGPDDRDYQPAILNKLAVDGHSVLVLAIRFGSDCDVELAQCWNLVEVA